jgi:hypothetical protein
MNLCMVVLQAGGTKNSPFPGFLARKNHSETVTSYVTNGLAGTCVALCYGEHDRLVGSKQAQTRLGTLPPAGFIKNPFWYLIRYIVVQISSVVQNLNYVVQFSFCTTWYKFVLHNTIFVLRSTNFVL